MDIVQVTISAGLGALITGIFALAKLRVERKNRKEDENNRLLQSLQELKDSLLQLRKDFTKHTQLDAELRANDSRARILRFGDEAKRGIKHTEEHWKDVLKDIDCYEDYCLQHPEYENSRAVNTITFLTQRYQINLQKNDFLP